MNYIKGMNMLELNPKLLVIFSATILSALTFDYANADQTVINNNYGGQAAPSANNSPCNPYAPPSGAGTYNVKNSDGGSNNIYTTGNKQPYLVDGCNNNNSNNVQPYVYAQPPGPGPKPGPRPGPAPR